MLIYKIDVEIEVATSEISRDDLIGYCEHHLHLESANKWDFFPQACIVAHVP